MQNEIVQAGNLLDENGILIQKGWARDLILTYNRSDIKTSKYSIKEWDYYCILQDKYGIAITVADLAYVGVLAVNLFDFTNNTEISDQVLIPFPLGKMQLPAQSSVGNIIIKNKKINIAINIKDGNRNIEIQYPGFAKGKGLQASIKLLTINKDSMVIATPFIENKRAFYYNQKINCLAASGSFTYNGNQYHLNPKTATAVLDWGRGVWTYQNRWYWGSASTYVNGKPFGFNIGYGFGDTNAASENMLLYDGVAHKLDQVVFHMDTSNYLKPWKFSSNDKRFELDFEPAIDRYSNTNLILIKSVQHQVFGYFSGRVVLDDGTILQVQRVLGFAEDVFNRW